ncbi:CG42367 [Drosophila busckii]|uniref:CG42367 n=1 Tax=Drosophila busckii TaxID=30019 RepID=A0A0M4E710_DROBS|nr:CG42367 [Drosophila busckii]
MHTTLVMYKQFKVIFNLIKLLAACQLDCLLLALRYWN